MANGHENINNIVDYTGASAQKYIDSYTNRPEDAGSLEAIQGMLSDMGAAPGVGEPADLLNALLYGVQGKGGQAGLSLLAMLPFIGGGLKATKQMEKQASKYIQKINKKKLDELSKVLETKPGTVAKHQGGFFKNLLKNIFDVSKNKVF